jgi:protein involved in polysaccharide export with SLBB domain
MSGCNANAWMGDPAAAGYYKPTPTTIPILDRIDIIEEPLQRGELSRVTAEDLMPVDLTYRIAPGDTVTADIYGLYNSQQIHPVIRRVDQSGYFRVPEVGDVLAAGLTQQEFQDTLVEELGKVLMTHPSVQVSMADSTAFTYTMYGELQRWGVFTLTQPNLRLVDALALAGGVPQTTKKIYVIRQLALHDQVTPSWETDHGHKNAETRTPKNPDFHQGSSAPKNTETNLSIEDLIKQLDIGADASSPQSNAPDPSSDAPLDPPPVVPHNELEQKDSTGGNSGSEQPLDVSDLLVDTDQSDPTPAPTSGETELQSVSPGILLGDPDELLDVDDLIPTRASKKPPVDIDHLMGPSSRIPDAAPAFIYVPERDEWIAVDSGGDKSKKKHADVASPDTDTAVPEVILERIIEIPWKRLKNGDSSYNIVVRPDDRIYVASSPMGNVYLRGAVARPGVFQLPATGGLTLARMIAAAGGLGPTAKPEKVSLTRRIGDNLEATVTLNLAAIMQKTEPDIFLRADDLISVGTDWGSTPMAIIRNGFRTSYGFGFLLDRNFGNDVFGAPPRSGF